MSESKKVMPCYVCGDTQGKKDKHHTSRCLKCKREQSATYMRINKQVRYEKELLAGESGVYFCECGDYFISAINPKDKCVSCRKEN